MTGSRRILFVSLLPSCYSPTPADLCDDTACTEAASSSGDPAGSSTTDITPAESSSATTSSGSDVEPDACGSPSVWYRDADGDGYGDPKLTEEACEQPPGFVPDPGDCDDDRADVHEDAPETCGGGDRNCDGTEAPLCASCLEQLDAGSSTDGVYPIDPDGDGPLPAVEVWCDMVTDGGGWTLVQRTVWEPSETAPLRTGFADWKDVTIGSADRGAAFRMQGAAWPLLALDDEHLLRHEIRLLDGGSCAPLFYKGEQGVVTVDDTSAWIMGTQADVPFFSAEELSTLDSGPSGEVCVGQVVGAPWFYANCCSTCPSFAGQYWTEPHPMANYVGTTEDLFGNLHDDVCPGETELSMSFHGIAAMEYYVR